MLAAQADTAPVLISGASGTGKGAICRWIHANSPRATRPLIQANPQKSLLQQIRPAQGGTFVIDEISEYPLAEQKLLLGFIKTKSVPHPENESMPILLNVRIMATTSHALENRAQGGLFNSELLSKLTTFRIEMPPLSKRAEEFDDIVMGIVGEITRELHKEHLKEIAPSTWEHLRDYTWPGNLRELRNVLRLAVLTAKGDQIEAVDLPDFGPERVDFRATREQFEKIYIMELLKTFDWQIDKTCRMTRMDKDTLLTKMSQYGIPADGSLSH